MQMAVGKHKGKELERLLFDDPGYIAWMLDENLTPGSPIDRARRHVATLIDKFDSHPIQAKCSGRCGRPGTRFSCYKDNPSPWFFCESCDPYFQGANRGALSIHRTYREALLYCQLNGNRQRDFKYLIDVLADAKGFGKPRSIKRLQEFFK